MGTEVGARTTLDHEQDILLLGRRVEDLETRSEIARDQDMDIPTVPELFTSFPPIVDSLVTETSVLQTETVEDCLPYLTGSGKNIFDFNSSGLPKLEREDHIIFLNKAIESAKYLAFDPVRPWVLYWCLTALSVLGAETDRYRQRVVETISPEQNATGGFGGGHGQFSHIAASYAAILSLAIVGGSESLGLIDRHALWKWLGQLKQSDGGFRVAIGGEEDIRGAYCAMVIITLLALPLELPPDAPARASGFTSLVDGLPEHLSRCQTFEGGISCKPQTEAHCAYAFCALASLCILGPPHEMISKYLDVPLLMSWLSARQLAPEGGFSGRTNKLVDGCYSHWVGACSPLIEAALTGPQSSISMKYPKANYLYNKEGLARYILSCCQAEKGGLRDKPTAHPDAYHSCYVLAGLSSTQYFHYCTDVHNTNTNYPFDYAFRWACSEQDSGSDDDSGKQLFDAEDKILSLHPIYVIPWAAAERCHTLFAEKAGF